MHRFPWPFIRVLRSVKQLAWPRRERGLYTGVTGMLTLIMAAVGAVPTAVDAERAMSRDAQINGQWTASRAYAGPDAVIFTPQAVWARDFLRGRKNPPAAIRWAPNA